jgi:hypothetical protein
MACEQEQVPHCETEDLKAESNVKIPFVLVLFVIDCLGLFGFVRSCQFCERASRLDTGRPGAAAVKAA